jgi:anti-sigma regulatory factor (Ser/Thr protein kinase)
MAVVPFSFSALDGIAFAASRGRLKQFSPDTKYAAGSLDPFMEMRQLCADRLLPVPDEAPWLDLDGAASFHAALRAGRRQWTGAAAGFFRIGEHWTGEDTDWIGFGLAAQKAATASGFHRRIAAQFAAALDEMASNICEHSGARTSGIAAFRAGADEFEFAVADRGMGVLESLRSNDSFGSLRDHGEALRLALTDGVTRTGEPGRGKGFRPIFVGLANLSGALRFRSGDHAYVIDGQKIDTMYAKTAQKVPLQGFLISVACRRGQPVGPS